jgi:hypothetical protein
MCKSFDDGTGIDGRIFDEKNKNEVSPFTHQG